MFGIRTRVVVLLVLLIQQLASTSSFVVDFAPNLHLFCSSLVPSSSSSSAALRYSRSTRRCSSSSISSRNKHIILSSSSNSGDERESLSSLPLKELRRQCRLRGVNVSGNKEELSQRLELATSSFPPTETDQSAATDEGRSAVEMKKGGAFGVVDSSPSSGERRNSDGNVMRKAKNLLRDIDDDADSDDNVVDARNRFESGGRSRRTNRKEYVEGLQKKLDEVQEEITAAKSAGTETKDGSEKQSNDSSAAAAEEEIDEEDNFESWNEDGTGGGKLVDSLDRSTIEFTIEQENGREIELSAFTVATKNSLQRYLAGGAKAALPKQEKSSTTLTDTDDEVKGILFLSDAFGYGDDETRELAAKIAYECQPCVVMVPDLFRGKPASKDDIEPAKYEAWRTANANEDTVLFDIRACATQLREKYGVASVNVFGTCFGGGRALEVAFDEVVRPSSVVALYPTRYDSRKLFAHNESSSSSSSISSSEEEKPKVSSSSLRAEDHGVAIMGIFAGKDTHVGARKADAIELEELLSKAKAAHKDKSGDGGGGTRRRLNADGCELKVRDVLIKTFEDEDHGFAHRRNISSLDDVEENEDEDFDSEDVEDEEINVSETASILTTAWMSTYGRMSLPTTVADTLLEENEDDDEEEDA
jgi:dienelactone hydrolase